MFTQFFSETPVLSLQIVVPSHKTNNILVKNLKYILNHTNTLSPSISNHNQNWLDKKMEVFSCTDESVELTHVPKMCTELIKFLQIIQFVTEKSVAWAKID